MKGREEQESVGGMLLPICLRRRDDDEAEQSPE